VWACRAPTWHRAASVCRRCTAARCWAWLRAAWGRPSTDLSASTRRTSHVATSTHSTPTSRRERRPAGTEIERQGVDVTGALAGRHRPPPPSPTWSVATTFYNVPSPTARHRTASHLALIVAAAAPNPAPHRTAPCRAVPRRIRCQINQSSFNNGMTEHKILYIAWNQEIFA